MKIVGGLNITHVANYYLDCSYKAIKVYNLKTESKLSNTFSIPSSSTTPTKA